MGGFEPLLGSRTVSGKVQAALGTECPSSAVIGRGLGWFRQEHLEHCRSGATRRLKLNMDHFADLVQEL